MKLYRYTHKTSVVPATNCEGAMERYDINMQAVSPIEAKDFEVIIEHEDFIKIFRLARLLTSIDQYDATDVQTLTSAYVNHLGYNLTEDELWDGILVWAERFDDVDDEEIEDWIN